MIYIVEIQNVSFFYFQLISQLLSELLKDLHISIKYLS